MESCSRAETVSGARCEGTGYYIRAVAVEAVAAEPGQSRLPASRDRATESALARSARPRQDIYRMNASLRNTKTTIYWSGFPAQDRGELGRRQPGDQTPPWRGQADLPGEVAENAHDFLVYQKVFLVYSRVPLCAEGFPCI